MSKLSETGTQLAETVLAANPTHRQFLTESCSGITEEEAAELDAYLRYLLSAGHTLDYLADCYNVIVMDTLREQVYFRRHGRYRHSTYAQVADSVYQNPEYMEQYMVGLAITLYLWPAHRKLKKFFQDTLPTDRTGTYFEIGPGHGLFLMCAMRRGAFSRYTAIDISAKSVQLTRDVLSSGAFGRFSRYEIVEADFLQTEPAGAPFDALTMGEVLEHVEEPVRFLSRIRELTSAESYIFVSTCINAPAIDHISLFTSVAHLHELVAKSGLMVREECIAGYQGMSPEETQAQKLPLNIAMSLGHG